MRTGNGFGSSLSEHDWRSVRNVSMSHRASLVAYCKGVMPKVSFAEQSAPRLSRRVMPRTPDVGRLRLTPLKGTFSYSALWKVPPFKLAVRQRTLKSHFIFYPLIFSSQDWERSTTGQRYEFSRRYYTLFVGESDRLDDLSVTILYESLFIISTGNVQQHGLPIHRQ